MTELDGKLDALCQDIAAWRERKGFRTDWLNVPEKLMLVVTELAEAMEAYRTLPGDVLQTLKRVAAVSAGPATFYESEDTPVTLDAAQELELHKHTIANIEEELADAAIRLFDLSSSLGMNLEEAILRKMDVNERRPHRHGKER